MSTIERHLTDSELLRLLDGQDLETDGPAGWDAAGAEDAARDTGRPNGQSRAHAEACSECARALATLQAGSRHVTEWLGRAAFEAPGPEHFGLDASVLDPSARLHRARELHPEPLPADATAVRNIPRVSTSPRPTAGPGTAPRRPAAPGTRAFLKAAAVLLLLAAPLAAFPGVRAWVVERIAPPPSPPEAVTAPAEAAVVVLRFTPSPGGFEIRFPQGATGTLALDRAAGEEAELRAEGGDPETVVTASSLEIRNPGTGRYELALPGAVAGVWVRVGDRAVAVTDNQIDRGTVIELGQ